MGGNLPEPSPVDDKIATSTAVSASTEVENDQKTHAEFVAAIVDSNDTDHDQTEETTPAANSANLCETSAESEDTNSEDDQPEISAAQTAIEATTQSVNSEAIAKPVTSSSDQRLKF